MFGGFVALHSVTGGCFGCTGLCGYGRFGLFSAIGVECLLDCVMLRWFWAFMRWFWVVAVYCCFVLFAVVCVVWFWFGYLLCGLVGVVWFLDCGRYYCWFGFACLLVCWLRFEFLVRFGCLLWLLGG